MSGLIRNTFLFVALITLVIRCYNYIEQFDTLIKIARNKKDKPVKVTISFAPLLDFILSLITIILGAIYFINAQMPLITYL